MKNIRLYDAEKYRDGSYKSVSAGIYLKENMYYMSFAFEQEPEYGEGADSSYISQYPLEDLLDKFNVFVSDFYKELNSRAQKECFVEVSSNSPKKIENMTTIIGKHVYNRNSVQNGEEFVDLVIE